jgi:hypothetical protein
MSITNSNDTIGNRTRDHPACKAVDEAEIPNCCLCTRDCGAKVYVEQTVSVVKQFALLRHADIHLPDNTVL